MPSQATDFRLTADDSAQEKRLSGTLLAWGIREICTRGAFSQHIISPPLDGARWRIGIGFQNRTDRGNQKVLVVCVLALAVPGEPLSLTGERLGHHALDFTLKTSAGTVIGKVEATVKFTPGVSGWTGQVRQLVDTEALADHQELREKDCIVLNYSITSQVSKHQKVFSDPIEQFTLLSSVSQLCNDKATADVCFIIQHPFSSAEHIGFIYAHSKILSRFSYFNAMLKSGFSEQQTPDQVMLSSHDWEEEWDSDYEDDEPADMHKEDFKHNAEQWITSESQPPEFCVTKSWYQGKRVVVVTDASYRTYLALMWYIYTGCVAFAPLTSEWQAFRSTSTSEGPAKRKYRSRADYKTRNTRAIGGIPEIESPWASAKSVYRLADRLQLDDLKRAAFEQIQTSLSPQTVLEEVNSPFSQKYGNVRVMEREYLIKHWAAVSATPSFKDFVSSMLCGYPADLIGDWVEVFNRLSPIKDERTNAPQATEAPLQRRGR